MAVDPLVASQCRRASDLVGAPFEAQQRFDLRYQIGTDARSLARTPTAQAADLVSTRTVVAGRIGVAAQFAADRAGGTIQLIGNGTKRKTRVAQ